MKLLENTFPEKSLFFKGEKLLELNEKLRYFNDCAVLLVVKKTRMLNHILQYSAVTCVFKQT